MTTTITALDTTGTATGITVLSPYSQTQAGRSIVHEVIGGGLAFTIIPPNKLSGDVQILVASETLARAMVTLLAKASRFSLAESTDPLVSMVFIVTGDVTMELDSQTQQVWIVTIPYQTV